MATRRLKPALRTANDELLDRAIRHAALLERYKRGLYTRLSTIADPVFEDVLSEIAGSLNRIRGHEETSFRTARLRGWFTDLAAKNRKTLKEGFARVQSGMSKELKSFAITEAEFAQSALRASIPVTLDIAAPTKAFLEGLVTTEPMQGKLLGEWFSDLDRSTLSRLGQEIRSGIAQGRGIAEIARNANKVADVSRSSLEAIARTVSNAVSSRARDATYQRSNVVKAIRIVATLDGRTTVICAGLDGRVFPVDEGLRPPFHVNCRTTTAPVLKSWRELGINLKEAPPSTRAQLPGLAGTATEKTTWATFLGRQSKEFQDDFLGVERAKLWRAGKVKLDRFVDYTRANPKQWTLDELRRREGL